MLRPFASVVIFLALVASPVLFAQGRQEPNVRYPPPGKREASIKSVVGDVVDSQGNKLPQAVVHLKNKKTLEVKTRIADQDGKYAFRGLDRNSDYEVHAEYNGASSAPKGVNSVDDRDEIYLQLQVPSR